MRGHASVRIHLVPSDLGKAATGLVSQGTDLHEAIAALASALAGCAGMAGNDAWGHRFAAMYDPATAALQRTFAAGQKSLQGMATGLVTTANNYLQADHHSTTGKARGTGTKLPPPGQIPGQHAGASPPPAAGQGSPGLPSWLAKYWPNGHQNLLREAATYYGRMAAILQMTGSAVESDLNAITDTTSEPSVAAMHDFLTLIYNRKDPSRAPLSAAQRACAQLSGVCTGYADLIDSMHSRVEHALAGTGLAVGLTSAVGGVIDFFTDGLTTGLVSEADEAEASAILGPIAADFTTAVENELASADLGSLATMLEDAAENAPELEPITADTTPAENVADDELEEELADAGQGGDDGGPPPLHMPNWNSGDDEDPKYQRNPAAIARELSGGYTRKEITDAIHTIKRDPMVRSVLGRNNPDIVVNTSNGDVYLELPDGSPSVEPIDNIYEYLPDKGR